MLKPDYFINALANLNRDLKNALQCDLNHPTLGKNELVETLEQRIAEYTDKLEASEKFWDEGAKLTCDRVAVEKFLEHCEDFAKHLPYFRASGDIEITSPSTDLDGFTKIYNSNYGLCGNTDMSCYFSMTDRNTIYSAWAKYSGHVHYPIQVEGEETKDSYVRAINKYNGEYGALRAELLAHYISFCHSVLNYDRFYKVLEIEEGM